MLPLAQLKGSRQSSSAESKWDFYFCRQSTLKSAVLKQAVGLSEDMIRKNSSGSECSQP
jgi:hypothetical protein